MTWLFVGPSLLAGIGQVTKTYCDLVGGEYCEYYNKCQKDAYDNCFAFILPVAQQLEMLEEKLKICKNHFFMTVCETEPVNPAYKLIEGYKPMYVPSNFAKNILEKQFPSMECKILRHYVPIPRALGPPARAEPYVFYTIGNILDPRKNIQGLLRAFAFCNFENARLVLKATCNKAVTINQKNVAVINGLLPQDQLEKIHNGCHCYINCSHSEGVGMGAVEAAMRDKPIIITDYGGLKEYVKTPYVIKCERGPCGITDFLFTPDLNWGHPNLQDLVSHMRDCYERGITTMDHSHTRELIGKVPSDLQLLPSIET